MTQLEHIVAVANKKYFGNRLKNVKIKWSSDLPKRSMAVTRSQHGKVPKGTRKFYIEIDKGLRKYRAVSILTVIHELVHVEQWDQVPQHHSHHGRKFQNRMKDLASKGAFNGLW